MKALSLFSGIGGIDLAAHWAGIETVAFCEREPFCQKILRKHWPDIPIYDDVKTLTKERLDADGIGTIDFIHGGYPCQPFSHAGKRQGTADDRHLWPEMFRLIQACNPRWFLGENVAGHVSLGLDIVLADLESIGYAWEAFIIPAAAVGSPNRRDRIEILGYPECLRQLWESRGRTDTLFKDRYQQLEKGFMANPTSAGLSQWGRSERTACSEKTGARPNHRSERRSEIVAHSSSERCGETWGDQFPGSEKWTAGSDSAGETRTTQSGLGGDANGFPCRMDGHRWPAPYGANQYEWEPPRVATGVKDRVGRLKSLGNAVNPYQFYPILEAIKQIDDMMQLAEGHQSTE